MECWWCPFDWSFAGLIAPVVTTISFILSSNQIQNGDILVPAYPGCPGKRPLNERRHCGEGEHRKYTNLVAEAKK